MPTLGLLQFLCSKHGIKDTIWLVIFFFFFVSWEPFVKLKTVLFLWCGVSKIWHKSYCMIGNFCKGHFSQVERHLPLVSWFIFSTALCGMVIWGDFPKPNMYLVLATTLHQFHCYAYGWGWTQLKFVHMELFYCPCVEWWRWNMTIQFTCVLLCYSIFG